MRSYFLLKEKGSGKNPNLNNILRSHYHYRITLGGGRIKVKTLCNYLDASRIAMPIKDVFRN